MTLVTIEWQYRGYFVIIEKKNGSLHERHYREEERHFREQKHFFATTGLKDCMDVILEALIFDGTLMCHLFKLPLGMI